jgi:hypothetical protein
MCFEWTVLFKEKVRFDMSRATDLLRYAQACHTDVRGLLEAAYFHEYGKVIPVGALDTDVTLFETEEELPKYMERFIRVNTGATEPSSVVRD